jgi:hypothetical protein
LAGTLGNFLSSFRGSFELNPNFHDWLLSFSSQLAWGCRLHVLSWLAVL